LALLESTAPTGRKPKLATGDARAYWRSHDALYPGGSAASREWKWLADAVRERDEHACVVCRSTEALQVDHIRPLSQGGANQWSNLWTLCKLCHSSKTGRRL
jgi:5-methylcytosine-specific restriction endonuclease McrA